MTIRSDDNRKLLEKLPNDFSIRVSDYGTAIFREYSVRKLMFYHKKVQMKVAFRTHTSGKYYFYDRESMRIICDILDDDIKGCLSVNNGTYTCMGRR